MSDPFTDIPDDGGSDVALAGELALGLLEGEALDEALELFNADPIFAALVAEWRLQLSVYDEEVVEARARPAVKAALEARLFGDERVPVWRRLWPWQLATGAAALAAVWFALAPVPPVTEPDAAAPVYVAELSAQDDSLRLVAAYDPAEDAIVIRRTEGQAQAGRALQLWGIAPDSLPVSIGVLPDDPDARFAVPADLADRVAGLTLAVSDEPPGGSPTGQPTGAVLAAAPLEGI
ncbi:anti-sigma factor [Chachezhania antarctica]|uniref:anti-sigma factor n=1 Tax=Chachezhania antarctica TaxID=2340860 RepID=UPI000EAC9CDD|nr:anti-sigma factor [Chachezhania antarctica]